MALLYLWKIPNTLRSLDAQDAPFSGVCSTQQHIYMYISIHAKPYHVTDSKVINHPLIGAIKFVFGKSWAFGQMPNFFTNSSPPKVIIYPGI